MKKVPLGSRDYSHRFTGDGESSRSAFPSRQRRAFHIVGAALGPAPSAAEGRFGQRHPRERSVVGVDPAVVRTSTRALVRVPSGDPSLVRSRAPILGAQLRVSVNGAWQDDSGDSDEDVVRVQT